MFAGVDPGFQIEGVQTIIMHAAHIPSRKRKVPFGRGP